MTDERIRYRVEHSKPLHHLEETGQRWILGDLWIDKDPLRVCIGWGTTPGPSTRFRLQPFDFTDLGRRGSAVIFRAFDRDCCEELPEEWAIGWVSPELETEASTWIATLNRAISAAVGPSVPSFRARRDHDIDDPERIREIIGDSSPVIALRENTDEDGPSWGLGRVWLYREQIAWVCAGEPSPYGPAAHFFRRAFTHPISGLGAVAVYFHFSIRGVCRHDCLCGWVPIERETEANGWVMFLNAEIDRVRAEERARELERAIATRKPG